MIQPRPSRRLLALVTFVLVSLLGVPAAAGGTAADGAAAGKTDANLERFGFDAETDGLAAIKLHCRGSIADTPVVGCSWRAPDDAGIVGFQLWNLQTAPTEGVRNLVAELGADASSYVDDAVAAPASYLYVVLGVDTDGEIVARSRVDRARLGDPTIERLRLTCDGVDGDTPSVTCGWTAPEDAAATYVLYRNRKGEDRAVIATLGADSTGFTDTTVACGVRYRYRLVGLDADGEIVATSRRDAAGCGERDHERVKDRDGESDGERSRGHRHDKHGDTDTDAGADPADDGDTVVAAVTESADESRSADHDRRDGGDRDRRGRGR